MTARDFTDAAGRPPLGRQDGADHAPAARRSAGAAPSALRVVGDRLAGSTLALVEAVVAPPAPDETPNIVATPERLHDWARGARAGERFVYATLMNFPPRSPGGAAARLLADRGLVRLHNHRVREVEPGVFLRNHFAVRSSKAWPLTRRRPRRAGEPDIVAEVEALATERLLPVLERAAAFARPCPTNRQLAARLGCADPLIAAAFDALKALRMIATAAAPAPTQRVVTIVATGLRTGMCA